jgi:predicted deacetylase
VTPKLAVALHDVEPATFATCARIREWLANRGVDRVTLLVIPAAGGHPFYDRSVALQGWLLGCAERGVSRPVRVRGSDELDDVALLACGEPLSRTRAFLRCRRDHQQMQA